MESSPNRKNKSCAASRRKVSVGRRAGKWFGTDKKDRVVEIAALTVLIAQWVYVACRYGDLPAELPLHFDFEREGSPFDPRWHIWILPCVSAAVYALLSWVQRYPHRFFYPVKVTDRNRNILYGLAVRTFRIEKLLLVVLYAYAGYNEVSAACSEMLMSVRPLHVLGAAAVLIPLAVVVRMARYK